MAYLAGSRSHSWVGRVRAWLLWWRSRGVGAVVADCWLAVATLWAATELPVTALIAGIPLAVTLALRVVADYVAPVAQRGGDATRLILTPTQAVKTAEALLNRARIAMAARMHDADLWLTLALYPLAALLYAASPVGNNGGMGWVRWIVERMRADGGADHWLQAIEACGDDSRIGHWLHDLHDVTRWDARQRRSVAEAMASAVHPGGRRCG